MDGIEIEGDSVIVVNAVRKDIIPTWVLNSYISRIIESLRDFSHFTINHIYREGNKWVDNLVNVQELMVTPWRFLEWIGWRTRKGRF